MNAANMDNHLGYPETVVQRLKAAKLRSEVDTRSERMNQKIRTAQMQKVPYMLVVGDSEIRDQAVAVRHREHGDLGAMPLEGLAQRLREEVGQSAKSQD